MTDHNSAEPVLLKPYRRDALVGALSKFQREATTQLNDDIQRMKDLLMRHVRDRGPNRHYKGDKVG